MSEGRLRVRDVGGADAVPMSDRGKPLDVGAEHAPDRLRLGLAQLRKLMSDVSHRAVLLAQLSTQLGLVIDYPDHRQVPHAGGVPLVGEHLGERLGRAERRVLGDDAGVVEFDEPDPTARELQDGRFPLGHSKEAQSLRRQVVVLLVEVVASGLGELEVAGGPAASAGAEDALLDRLDRSFLEQLLKMAAYGGRRQLESQRQICCCGRAVLKDRSGHARAGRRVGNSHSIEFHNTIVALIRACFK